MTSISNLQNFKSLSINYLHSVVVENYANKCAVVWCAVLGLVCSVKPAGGIFPWIRSLSRELNTHPPSRRHYFYCNFILKTLSLAF